MYKIYLVEDDGGISSEIKRQAQTWGYQVKVAEDFKNITAEFTAFEPHSVLMDISLPF